MTAIAKGGGFPCRYGSCDVRFFVASPGATDALHAASVLRVEHETLVHDYAHKSWEQYPVRPFSAGPAPRRSSQERTG